MAPSADLKLPPPVNKAAFVEDVEEPASVAASAPAGAGAADEPLLTAVAPAPPKFASGGLIYPPPDIRAIVDKTATFVARNGAQFEAKIRGDERANTKFAFMADGDPYNAYYRAKIQLVQSGDGPLKEAEDAAGGIGGGQLMRMDGADEKAALEQEEEDRRRREERSRPEEPRPHDFELDIPNITAVDLDVLKLTALYTARKGRSFASAVLAREGRSFQFEFLRPSHSLFGYFNRMVEQYRLVLDPPAEALERLNEVTPAGVAPPLGAGRGGGRVKLLEEARKRAKFEKWTRERRKQKETEEESERAAFMEIDWNDFVVVGTVELTETDAHIDLPPPMSLRDIENMSMAQKRMAAMIMEVEGGDADESKLLGLMDVPGGEGASAGASEPVRAKPSHMNPERAAYAAGGTLPAKPGSSGTAQAQDEDDVEMDVDDDSDEEPAPAPQVEEIQRADGQGPMRVRKGYVPKTLADRKAAADAQTTKCPVCGEQIPLSDMDEHVRIELLNPRFREQRQELETKRAQHNALQEGADPSRFLRQFAGARTDIFGAEAEEDARKRREEEEARLRREREKIIWDGHANSRTATRDTFNKTSQVEETMAQIQRKFNVGAPEANIGPQVPGMAAAGPSTMAPPAGPSGSAPSIHPSCLASGIDPSAALKRPAEGYPAGQPDAQRHAGLPAAPAAMGAMQPPTDAPTGPSRPGAAQVNVNSLPKQSSGALYDEGMWLRYNPYPIALKVTFPDAPATSPLCDGRTEVFADTPMTSTIASVRDRVHAMLDGAVGAAKLKLKIGGKAATLKQTLAHWNLLDNDEIVVSIGK